MKKIVFVLCIMIGLAACGTNGSNPNVSPSDSTMTTIDTTSVAVDSSDVMDSIVGNHHN